MFALPAWEQMTFLHLEKENTINFRSWGDLRREGGEWGGGLDSRIGAVGDPNSSGAGYHDL